MTQITSEKFNPFFVAVIKGDLETIREFFRKFPDDELVRIVDVAKKSPLHHAAREGRTSVADYLLTKGFATNARERTLKTPLHYACLFGHAVLADLLLKKGADLTAKDSSGRTCFHFACCSWSNEALALILGLKPELLNLGDNIGRTGLHYAVWNSCDAQVDILRTILERGGNVNQSDDYGKTALHYAAEGGRQRAIPILIQKGADMSLREARTHKTPLELACNERIRELMVVYSSAPYSLKTKDHSFLDNAIKGQSVVVKKETLFTEEKLQPKARLDSSGPARPVGQSSSNLVPEYWRSRMIKIMEQLQDIGVKSHQHIKRPYLFTGSWMEGVTTIEQLYDRVRDITASEAMLRLFNIIQPFEGALPAENKDELAVSHFYGEYYNFEVPKETRVDLSAIGNNVIEQSKISGMHSALELANKKNEELQVKIDRLLKDSQELENKLRDAKARSTELDPLKKQLQTLQEALRAKEAENLSLTKQSAELDKRLKDEHRAKASVIEALQKDAENKDLELGKCKKELAAAKAQVKTLEAKISDTPDLGTSTKVMTKFERKRYVSQDLAQEDKLALQALMKRIRATPTDLPTRMRNEDKNADGLIGTYEFLQFLEKLKTPNNEAQSLRKIAGFPKYDEIFIEDFVELVNRKMKLDSATETKILQQMIESFKKKGLSIKEVMAKYDSAVIDNHIDLEEFKQFSIDLALKLDDDQLIALFNILDEDGSGKISLEELRVKLGAKEKEANNEPKPNTGEQELHSNIKGIVGPIVPKDIPMKDSKKDVLRKALAVNAFDDALDKHRDSLDQVPNSERLKELLAKNGSDKDFLKLSDTEPLVGEIKLQFQKLSAIKVNLSDFKTFYLLIRLPGITKNWLEKEIFAQAMEAFKYAMRISIMNVLAENVGPAIVLKLVGQNKENLRTDLGTCEVKWKKGLEIPNQWVMNDSFTLEGGPNKPNPCEIKIQLKWINAASPEFKASVYDDYSANPQHRESHLQGHHSRLQKLLGHLRTSRRPGVPDQQTVRRSRQLPQRRHPHLPAHPSKDLQRPPRRSLHQLV